jgi:ribosomal protein L11 methylase PrmA
MSALVVTPCRCRRRIAKFVAFDIGTGTGILSYVLALRDVDQIVATDQDPRAGMCAVKSPATLAPDG